MPDTEEGKITLAILGTKLDLLLSESRETRLQVEAIRSCQDRWSYIPGDVGELKQKVDALETDVIALKTRTGIIGGINAALAVIGSTISGYLGTR
jgi:hypothetical protein